MFSVRDHCTGKIWAWGVVLFHVVDYILFRDTVSQKRYQELIAPFISLLDETEPIC